MERCKWQHLGGAIKAYCMNRWVTDYHYGDTEKIEKLLPIVRIIREFKFCPFCGKPIELPEWMKEGEIQR